MQDFARPAGLPAACASCKRNRPLRPRPNAPSPPTCMKARDLQQADEGTPLEVPPPVLFNTWKHHAGALRQRITDVARGGEVALVEVGRRMAVLGTKLMDLYTGLLSPREICDRALEQL